MQITRRRFFRNTVGAGLSLGVVACTDFFPTAQASGNTATYLNPVLAGDHPDAGAIRVGNDFFLTHSSFDYAPGLPIWSSKDLVNWTLAGAALKKYYGSVWAPLWRAPRIHGELLKLGIEVFRADRVLATDRWPCYARHTIPGKTRLSFKSDENGGMENVSAIRENRL